MYTIRVPLLRKTSWYQLGDTPLIKLHHIVHMDA
jgi:hypothetical protein